ncbi:GPP34 family phosphoprotein [Nonomuraea gerenzanensis]|uniref:Putative integral membrane protein n=1 Tax=Nonomuraea gerenzanensis TaxID=93944 RepID=A0A1M4ENQ0_9ACTN|nr:GPP34 family phosphoprotein [Nonomuraea gerenzanensis]UBU11723.1 GPP34 family phosphoprotein [Nonomuraea gerenzanensis]SBP00223.1 putative integral membrane protein [Nonomuraea gerenzanensis]
MKHHETLTRSAFLLAFDLRRQRLAQRTELGYLLRAAALAELLLEGCLADESGKARAVAQPAHAGPGSLRAIVWEQISGSPPRSWRRWIGKDHAKAVGVVRDELAADRLIRVERRRVLFIPVERIVPRKAYLSRRLAERVGRAIRGGQPVGRLDQDVRVLAALAGAAGLKAVLERGEARRSRSRIEQLSLPVEPITTALRKSVEAAKSSSAAG